MTKVSLVKYLEFSPLFIPASKNSLKVSQESSICSQFFHKLETSKLRPH